MSRWSVRDTPEPSAWGGTNGTHQPTFTVEKALTERLERLRESIVREAEAHNWDAVTVDRVLTDAGLPPMTTEYVVEYIQETFQQVRVRARDKAHAAEVAGLDANQGMRLQAVHEVREG